MPLLRSNRLVCYLVLLSNICVSNLVWIFQSTPLPNPPIAPTASEETTFLSPNELVSKPFEQQSQVNADTNNTDASKIQGFVISSNKRRADQFLRRNKESLTTTANINASPLSIKWFPAMNGNDQKVLDEYAQLTGFAALNATRFVVSEGEKNKKNRQGGGYATPHHTGCFMSHFHLLRLAVAGWNALPEQPRPEALLILEDDATCATSSSSSTMDEIQRILPTLPVDWDLLYIGGKPFSYHTLDPLSPDLLMQKKNGRLLNIQKDWTRENFRQWACRGALGRSATGPFAPDGSRNLSITTSVGTQQLQQLYWQTRYITNTHAYLVNPRRILRVLDVLENPSRDYQVPIDIALAEAGQRGQLKLLMSTMEFCVQDNIDSDGTTKKKKQTRRKPTPWQGLYYHKDLGGHRVDEIFFSECPGKL
jgi:GR25 family glycosyltransferase involved in LPS biosynthesis